MRDLLAKRIKARRKKDEHILAFDLVEYADIVTAITIMVIFRLYVFASRITLCDKDYLYAWAASNYDEQALLWNYMGMFGLCAFWIVASLVTYKSSNTFSLYISRGLRAVTLVILIVHAVFPMAIIVAHQAYVDIEFDHRAIGALGYAIELPIEAEQEFRFIDEDKEWFKRQIAFEKFEARCPKFFEKNSQSFNDETWKQWYPKDTE